MDTAADRLSLNDRLTPSEDEREVFAEALAWMRALDLTTAGPDTLAALDDVAEQLHVFQAMEAAGAPRVALQFTFKMLARLLVTAQVAHERETGTLIPEGDPISADEFRRRHISPIQAEARRVVRVIRRQARTDRSRCPRPRGRRHPRRMAARRAAGIRSGNDPGADEPEHPYAHKGACA